MKDLIFILRNNFSFDELKEICLQLKIDYENIPGDNKITFSRELIQYLSRRGRISELDKTVISLRPNSKFGLNSGHCKSNYEVNLVEIERAFFDAIEKDQIDKAISILKETVKKEDLKEEMIISFSGRWRSLNFQYAKGVFYTKEFEIEKNLLREALINLWGHYFG